MIHAVLSTGTLYFTHLAHSNRVLVAIAAPVVELDANVSVVLVAQCIVGRLYVGEPDLCHFLFVAKRSSKYREVAVTNL